MIKGSKVILRCWTEDDLPLLINLRNDISLQTDLMAQPRPNSRDRVIQWLSRRTESVDCIFFIVASSNDNRPLGFVQLANIDYIHGHGDLGICIHPSAHGTGIATEAMSLLEKYMTQTFQLRKISLQVLCNNIRAISFYSKIGFSQVGVLSAHVFLQGIYEDVLLMEKFL